MAYIPYDNGSGIIQLRPGSEAFGGGWQGMNTQQNPGSLPPNVPIIARNLRLSGGDWLTRARVSESYSLRGLGPPLLSESEMQPVMWLHPEASDNPRNRLWMAAIGCFGQVVGTGATAYHFDPQELPAFQAYSRFYSDTDNSMVIEEFDGKLWAGNKDALIEILIYPGVTGVPASDLSAAPSVFPATRFPGFTISWLCNRSGILYVGLTHNTTPATLSKVATWDGFTKRDLITGIEPTANAAVFADNLIIASREDNVRILDADDTVTLVTDAAFTCSLSGNAMAEFKDKLVIASGIGNLWTLNQANALSVVHTIASAAPDGRGITCVAAYEGLLLYGWNKVSPTYLSYCGRWDSESDIDLAHAFIDEYCPISSQIASFMSLFSMLVYRRQVYFGGGKVCLVRSEVGDLKAPLELLTTAAAPGVDFALRQMVRFPSSAVA